MRFTDHDQLFGNIDRNGDVVWSTSHKINTRLVYVPPIYNCLEHFLSGFYLIFYIIPVFFKAAEEVKLKFLVKKNLFVRLFYVPFMSTSNI